jgi:hypothetical protein
MSSRRSYQGGDEEAIESQPLLAGGGSTGAVGRHAAAAAAAPAPTATTAASVAAPFVRRAVLSEAEREALCREECNVWQTRLVLVPVFYVVLGFCISFPYVAQRQYLRHVLRLTPSVQGAVLGVVVQFPWFVKICFAFLSDSVPIAGLRRKPYCIIGVALCGAAWLALGLCRSQHPLVFCALSTLATLGLVLADVMVDAVVVFIVREYESLRTSRLGSLQTTTVRAKWWAGVRCHFLASLTSQLLESVRMCVLFGSARAQL